MSEKKTILKEIDLIKKELKDSPESPSLLNDLGVGHFLIGEYSASLKALEMAVRLEPKNSTYLFNLGNTYSEADQFDQAISCYLQALEVNPSHIGSLTNLAHCYEETEDKNKAYEVFSYIVKTAPDDPLSHFNLGNFLLRQNRHIEAVKSYEHSLLLDSGFTNAYYNIAWVLQQARVFGKAEEYTLSGLKTDPKNEELKQLLADIRSEAG